MLLADDFFLIAHDDRDGRSRLSQRAVEFGLAGAMLGELVLEQRIVCEGDHYARLKLQVHDLIPNRMYAVWATLGQSRRGDPEVFPSIPVGGTPNIIITDRDGSALYERPMQFCPLRPATTDRPMLVINVQYHSNHQNNGGKIGRAHV